jgi:hypothetical protein
MIIIIMCYIVYKFINIETEEENEYLLHNKVIKSIRWNYRQGKLKIKGFEDDIKKYKILKVEEYDVKNKIMAEIEFNKRMNNINDMEMMINKIKEDKNINEITMNNYKYDIKRMFNVGNYNKFKDIIENREKYIEEMEKKYDNDNTRSNIYRIIVKMGKIYGYINNENRDWIIEQQRQSDKLEDKMEENKQETIKDTRKGLIEKIDKMEDIDETIELILRLSVCYPQRDDYKRIKIIREEKDMNDIEKYDGYNKEDIIIINNHKTIKTNGKIEIEIKDDRI